VIKHYAEHYGPYVLVGIVAILAFAMNPSITGIAYSLIVIVGACTIWLLRMLYLNEVERQRRGE
jgi:ABC-type uncharacterized transport system permease subunit